MTQSSSSPSSVGGASSSKTPCCSKVGIKRGPWTPEEDQILSDYLKKEGEGRWRTLPKRAGLLRCGKSCRLRWMNYLRPSLKRGHIAPDEEDLILRLHRLLGNRWSLIAGRIPGRTDNEIKNFWNTHLSKKLIRQGIDPRTHKPLSPNYTSETGHALASICNPKPNPNPNPNAQELEVTCGSSYQTTVNKSTQVLRGTIMNQYENQIFECQNYEGVMKEANNDMCNGDIFSSFLDSLINENVVVNQEQPYQHGANWEAQIRSTMDTLGDIQNFSMDNNYGA